MSNLGQKTDEGLFPRSMPAERYWRRSAGAFFALAGVLAIVPVLVRVDTLGLVFAEGFAAFCAFRGFLRIRKGRTSHPESVVYRDLGVAPPNLQLAWHRRALPLGALAFVILSVKTAHDVGLLESGQVQEVSLYFPIGPIYEAFGYWPAVLVMPCLGILTIGVLLRRWRRLRATTTQ